MGSMVLFQSIEYLFFGFGPWLPRIGTSGKILQTRRVMQAIYRPIIRAIPSYSIDSYSYACSIPTHVIDGYCSHVFPPYLHIVRLAFVMDDQ